MATRRNGMGEKYYPMDDGEFERALEIYNRYIMDKVEILLEYDN